MIRWNEVLGENKDLIEAMYDFKKQTLYTDEQILDTINKVYNVGLRCGVSFEEAVWLVIANETMILQ
jgi:hypothetical protein